MLLRQSRRSSNQTFELVRDIRNPVTTASQPNSRHYCPNCSSTDRHCNQKRQLPHVWLATYFSIHLVFSPVPACVKFLKNVNLCSGATLPTGVSILQDFARYGRLADNEQPGLALCLARKFVRCLPTINGYELWLGGGTAESSLLTGGAAAAVVDGGTAAVGFAVGAGVATGAGAVACFSFPPINLP